MILEQVVLFTTILIAIMYDVRTHRIPNFLLGISLIVSIVLFLYVPGCISMGGRLTGLLTGIGLLFIPFAARGIGAGDVKLLGLIGFYVGVRGIISVTCVGFIIAAIYVFGAIITRRFIQYKNINDVFASFMTGIYTRKMILINEEEKKIKLPLALPLVIAALCVITFQWSIL